MHRQMKTSDLSSLWKSPNMNESFPQGWFLIGLPILALRSRDGRGRGRSGRKQKLPIAQSPIVVPLKGLLNRLQSLRKSGANLGPNSLFVRDRLQQRALRQS